MYTCASCKKQIDAEPAVKNACGSFCPECRTVISEIQKQAITAKKEARALERTCNWCGTHITANNAPSGKCDGYVCRQCETRRDWLLSAIRLSDHAAKYVARTEERERPGREDRERAMKAKAGHKLAADGTPFGFDERLNRIELMLNKFSKALGV